MTTTSTTERREGKEVEYLSIALSLSLFFSPVDSPCIDTAVAFQTQGGGRPHRLLYRETQGINNPHRDKQSNTEP